MSRIKITLLLLVFVLLIGLVFFLQFMWSHHTVTFNNPDNITLNIRKSIDGVNQKQIEHVVKNSIDIGFQNGDYCAEVESTTYDTTPLCFTVNNKAVSVSVDLGYSKKDAP